LLRELGTPRKPVLVKRGISADDRGMAALAEYVLSGATTT